MKTFKTISQSERTKINTFHSIDFDMHVLTTACKQLMSNPDPDFVCCLSSKLSSFIESEVFPLVERHNEAMKHFDNAMHGLNQLNKNEYECENTENSHNDLESN